MGHNDLVEFGVHLTGHDRDTIKQMLDDFLSSPIRKSNFSDKGVACPKCRSKKTLQSDFIGDKQCLICDHYW
jgi:hypothetical protein